MLLISCCSFVHLVCIESRSVSMRRANDFSFIIFFLLYILYSCSKRQHIQLFYSHLSSRFVLSLSLSLSRVSHVFDFYSKLTADNLISILKCSLIQFGFSRSICILIYLHVCIIFYLEFLMRAGGKKPYCYAENDQYIVSDITFPVAFLFFIYTRFISFLFFCGFVFVLR